MLFDCTVIFKKPYFQVPMATVAIVTNSSAHIHLHQSTIIWYQWQPLLKYRTEDILSQVLSIVYVSMVIATMFHFVQKFTALKFVHRAILSVIMFFFVGFSFSFYPKMSIFDMELIS